MSLEGLEIPLATVAIGLADFFFDEAAFLEAELVLRVSATLSARQGSTLSATSSDFAAGAPPEFFCCTLKRTSASSSVNASLVRDVSPEGLGESSTADEVSDSGMKSS